LFRISSKSKLISLTLLSIILAMALSVYARAQGIRNTGPRRKAALPTSISILESNKEQDGLIGPVHRVCTETAKLSFNPGKVAEGPRTLLETTVYDLQGNRIENTYYLVAESNPLVKEEYKYDERGNVTEMTQRNNSGAILSREIYEYEFDVVGNWNKMVTLLVVYEGGLSYEPVDVAYRTISYYFNEASAKVENSTSSLTTAPVVSSAADTVKEAGANGPGSKVKAVASLSYYADKSRPVAPPTATVNSSQMRELSCAAGALATDSQNVGGRLVVKAERDSAVSERPPKPQARLISDGAVNGELIMVPKANYPDDAKRAGVTGTVVVKVEIDTKGQVVSAVAVRGHPMLQASAVEAALRARFSPAISATQSKRSGVISFTFSLLR
jgi:TonB family protein